MIRAENIFKSYGNVDVLKGIDLEVSKAEIVSIVGASGAGKSTLLHILGTLDRPDGGQLFYEGNAIHSLNEKELSHFRNREIGFVFQFHHLLPEFTALENICIPAFIAGVSKKQAEDKANKLIDLLGLQERSDHKPAALSGGEQQRVAVARALINQPRVVFADEPSGNLDSQASEDLHKLIMTLRDELDQTFIIVTHNDELAGLADRKLTIKDGVIL